MDTVEDACDYADRLSTHGDGVHATIDDRCSSADVSYRHVGGKETVTIDDKQRKPGLLCSVLGGVGLVAGLTTGNPILAGAGAAVGTLGLFRLGHYVTAPTKQFDIPLATGGTASVSQKNGHPHHRHAEGAQAHRPSSATTPTAGGVHQILRRQLRLVPHPRPERAELRHRSIRKCTTTCSPPSTRS